MKKNIVNILITLVFAMVLYYFMIPPINLTAPEFYIFLVPIIIVFACLQLNKDILNMFKYKRVKFEFNIILLIPAIFLVIGIINLINSPLFMAKSYSKRINVLEDSEFSKDIKPVNFDKVPLLDRKSTMKLGDRVMGGMREFVSQYYVSELYTQINYKNNIVRVTPLEYADFIKYFFNRGEGVKGYIMVDSVNGNSKVIKLKKGMKYIPSAIFNEDMLRHLRFKYKTLIFANYNFEIDDKGNPYFVIPTIKYHAVGLKRDISGVILLDPITGKSKYYKSKDVPEWVDHVYDADIVIEQTNDWGTYKRGFLNSLFTQKDVVNTTRGYNYLAMDNDIYLYTGITSVRNDESNLGFILSNLRTKETKYYLAPGAEEYSAMSSSEGQVQEKKYKSTFPLLINLNNRPTYLMSLKDSAGLVKKYAFVDVEDYQKVTVSDAVDGIEVASKRYLTQFNFDEVSTKNITITITVATINHVVIDGKSVFYIEDTDKNRYSASISINKVQLPFLRINDQIEITYSEDGSIRVIKSIN